ncbi:MAG: HPr family phosphocarrier protein, partial [bacterium]
MQVVRSNSSGEGKVQPVVHELIVTGLTGFHFLPASQLAKIALEYEGTIEVEKGDRRENAKSALALVGLLAVADEIVKFRIIIDGPCANETFAMILKTLKGKLVLADQPAAAGQVRSKPGGCGYL